MGDLLSEVLAALEDGDVDALEPLLHEGGGRAPFVRWLRDQLAEHARGEDLAAELARRGAPLGFDVATLRRPSPAGLMTHVLGGAVEYWIHLRSIADEEGMGALETARLFSQDNPRALALCEMSSAVAACAVDLAQAVDDDEAAEALRRALATLEHIGTELTFTPNKEGDT
jgi:hypothetical protein